MYVFACAVYEYVRYMHVCVHVYVHTCVYVCIYVAAYIYVYAQRLGDDVMCSLMLSALFS